MRSSRSAIIAGGSPCDGVDVGALGRDALGCWGRAAEGRFRRVGQGSGQPGVLDPVVVAGEGEGHALPGPAQDVEGCARSGRGARRGRGRPPWRGAVGGVAAGDDVEPEPPARCVDRLERLGLLARAGSAG